MNVSDRAYAFIREFDEDYVEHFGCTGDDTPENLEDQGLIILEGDCLTIGYTFRLPSGKYLYVQAQDDEFDMIEVDNMNMTELAQRVAKDINCSVEQAMVRLKKVGIE